MKNIEEEFRTLRESESKPTPTLEDLEKIAERFTAETRKTRANSTMSKLLPECYTTFTFNNLNVKNFHEETLFFIFYALFESELQINAYNELIDRGFRFSKTLDSFVLFSDPKVADNRKRTVLVFNPFAWIKVHKDITFDEEFIGNLEERVRI